MSCKSSCGIPLEVGMSYQTEVDGSCEGEQAMTSIPLERGDGLEGKWKPKGSILLWIPYPGHPLPYQSVQEKQLSTSQSKGPEPLESGKEGLALCEDPHAPQSPPAVPHSLRVYVHCCTTTVHSSYHTHCSARPSTLCSRFSLTSFPLLKKRRPPPNAFHPHV